MNNGSKEGYSNILPDTPCTTELSIVQSNKDDNSNNDKSKNTSLLPNDLINEPSSSLSKKDTNHSSSNTNKAITSNPMSKLIQRKGRMIMLFYNQYESPLICIGPQCIVISSYVIILIFIGPIPLCVITFIAIASFLYFYSLWSLLNFYVIAIGLLIGLMQLSSYLLTVLINPGLPSRELWLENYNPDEMPLTHYRICERCQLIMNLDKQTEHCFDCDVCVEGMDHHCPWTSKCIGRSNLIPFYAFIGFTYLYIFYLAFGVFSILLFYNRK